jgi:hypothetical protein
MIYEILSILSVLLLMISSLVLLVNQNWWWNIIALAVQYLACFWLINLVWPLGMAAVKLIVGWMACAVLGSTPYLFESDRPLMTDVPGRIFRLVTAGMVWILVFSIAPKALEWIPTGMVIIWGGLVLVGMGLLQLGMTNKPARTIVGLLTLMSGFEILYSVLETSVLVTGLLALINLGLALVGSYLLVPGQIQELG